MKTPTDSTMEITEQEKITKLNELSSYVDERSNTPDLNESGDINESPVLDLEEMLNTFKQIQFLSLGEDGESSRKKQKTKDTGRIAPKKGPKISKPTTKSKRYQAQIKENAKKYEQRRKQKI